MKAECLRTKPFLQHFSRFTGHFLSNNCQTSMVVGVFKNNFKAQDAVREMLVSGFQREQINVFSPHASDPNHAQGEIGLGDELKQEAGMDDLFRSLASMFTDYDELTVYSDATRQGQVVLSVYADTEEEVGCASELMSHHSPLDVTEQLPRMGSSSPWGSLDTAKVPEDVIRNIAEHEREHDVRQVGNLRIYSRPPAGPAQAG